MERIFSGDTEQLVFHGLGGVRSVYRSTETHRRSAASSHLQAVINAAEKLDFAALDASRNANLTLAARRAAVASPRQELADTIRDARKHLDTEMQRATSPEVRDTTLWALSAINGVEYATARLDAPAFTVEGYVYR